MTKTEIIKDWLSIEGNSEKSMRVSIAEIAKMYGVKISVGMFHKTKVNSEHQSEHQSEHPEVNSEHPIGELTPELEMVLNRMGECTNLFDMVEVIRQFDVYVQKNNVSIKHLLNKKLDELLDWQLKLVADYGLDERLCFTF